MTVRPKPVPQGTNFRTAVQGLSPPWLQGPAGYRFMYSIAIQIDAIAEMLRLGVLARMPGYGTLEALPHSGNDRQILRGQNESDIGYITRLQQAYPTWKKAGGAQSVLGQIASYFADDTLGVPALRYVVNGVDENGDRFADWWTLVGGQFTYHRAEPNNWNWDDTWDQTRFWVIAYLPALTPWYIGDGHTIGGGQFIGFVSNGQVNAKTIGSIRALINKWKCAGSHAWPDGGLIFAGTTTISIVKIGAFVIGDGTKIGQQNSVGLFDPNSPPGPPMPDGTWGDPANRDPGALYLSGI